MGVWRALVGLRPLTREDIRSVSVTCMVATWLVATSRVVDEYLASFNPSGGPSMMPTMQPEGEWLLTFKWPLFALYDRLHRCVEWTEEDRRARRRRERAYERTAGRPVAVGDLVFALSPRSGKQICKRVIGLPGDTVLLDPRAIPLPRSAWLAPKSKDASASGSVNLRGRHLNDGEPEANQDDNDAPTRAPDGTIGSIKTEATYVTVPKAHVFLAGDNLGNSTDSRDYGPVPLALVKGRVVGRVRGGDESWLWRNTWGKVNQY